MFKKRFVKERFESKSFYPLFLGNLFLLSIIIFVFLPKVSGSCGFSVFLPRAISSEPVSTGGYVISILKSNKLYFGGKEISLDELRCFLRGQAKMVSSVLIKADQRANIATLVKVWDVFRESGVDQINIATNG